MGEIVDLFGKHNNAPNTEESHNHICFSAEEHQLLAKLTSDIMSYGFYRDVRIQSSEDTAICAFYSCSSDKAFSLAVQKRSNNGAHLYIVSMRNDPYPMTSQDYPTIEAALEIIYADLKQRVTDLGQEGIPFHVEPRPWLTNLAQLV